MDLSNDMPEETSPSMAESYELAALKAKRKADTEPDPTTRQALLDRHDRLLAASRIWASRYTVSTGQPYRGA